MAGEGDGISLDVVVTEKIEEFIQIYCRQCERKGESMNTGDMYVGKIGTDGKNVNVIPFRKLKAVVRKMMETRQSCDSENEEAKKYYLHEITEGSSIYIEPLKEPERNPELVKRLEKLKKDQEQAEYHNLTKNVSSKQQTLGEDFGTTVRTTSQELASITNFILSVVGCFAFAYFSSQYAFQDTGKQVIFSIVVATVVALAELYFMARTEI